MLHIRRPDSRGYEAVAYVRGADTAASATAAVPERGMLTVMNPSKEPLAVNVTLPLYYAGFAPMSKVRGDACLVARNRKMSS